MRLTPHFRLIEFTQSATAQRLGITNDPDINAMASLQVLCEQVLEPLREHVGEPVIISSGYRCPKLNAAVGGVKNSQHMKGEAADIHMPDLDKLKDWFVWLMNNTNFDQLILERASPTSDHWWIHVSCKLNPKRNRHQVIQGLIKRNA